MNYAIDIDRAVDGDDQATALSLAELWVAAAPEDAAAWSKLAHVHGIGEDFPKANTAASQALRISPGMTDDSFYLDAALTPPHGWTGDFPKKTC